MNYRAVYNPETRLVRPFHVFYLPQGYKTSTHVTDQSNPRAQAKHTEHWSGREDINVGPKTDTYTLRQAPDGNEGEYELTVGNGQRLLIPREAVESFRRRLRTGQV